MLKATLVEWAKANLIKKDIEEKCKVHMDTVKKQLEEDYKAKA